jgi:hypothetical protein
LQSARSGLVGSKSTCLTSLMWKSGWSSKRSEYMSYRIEQSRKGKWVIRPNDRKTIIFVWFIVRMGFSFKSGGRFWLNRVESSRDSLFFALWTKRDDPAFSLEGHFIAETICSKSCSLNSDNRFIHQVHLNLFKKKKGRPTNISPFDPTFAFLRHPPDDETTANSPSHMTPIPLFFDFFFLCWKTWISRSLFLRNSVIIQLLVSALFLSNSMDMIWNVGQTQNIWSFAGDEHLTFLSCWCRLWRAAIQHRKTLISVFVSGQTDRALSISVSAILSDSWSH